MNWLKFIFITALLVIFVVSTIVALFGAGTMLTAVFRSYVFKVEICEFSTYPYKSVPAMMTQDDSFPIQESERKCKIDYNRSKEDISNGLAMFLIAAPLSIIFFRKTKKFIYEG